MFQRRPSFNKRPFNGQRRNAMLHELTNYHKWVLTAFLNRGTPAIACHGTVFLGQGDGHGHIRLYVAQAMQRRGLLRFEPRGGGVAYWKLTPHGENLAYQIVNARKNRDE